MIKLKHLIEEGSFESQDTEHEFRRGIAVAKADYLKGYERDLDPDYLPPAFLKGYKLGWKAARKARGDTWWNRFNDKITDLLARMGSSRLR